MDELIAPLHQFSPSSIIAQITIERQNTWRGSGRVSGDAIETYCLAVVTGSEGHAVGRRAGCDERLVGRDAERAVASIAIDHALAGSPQLVVVEGEPGVGKSALARAIAEAMPAGSVVLWARSEEVERQLDFGVVDQLIREAGAAGLSSPPTIQRGGARPDPLVVGEVILGLAEEHSRDRALLVVIDDAQWADLASVQALSFVYRRLHDRRALLVIVRRPGAVNLEPFDRLVRDGRGHRLRLAPLNVPAVIDLVRSRTGLTLTARAAERLHEHTGGNPLETLALLEELDPVALTAGLGPLPAPRTYATMVLNRLAGCSLETEHLVAAVAVTGAVELEELARMIDAGRPCRPAVGRPRARAGRPAGPRRQARGRRRPPPCPRRGAR